MALSDQLAAYSDCEDLFSQAKADTLGARACFATDAQAKYFRLRLNHYRVLLRRESARIYEKMDAQYGKSDYDEFICQVKEDTEGNFWVYVSRVNNEILEVQSLSEISNGT
jgi:hypothetical protein